MRWAIRLVLTVPLLALAVFCAYGFLASFEPGPFLVFRIGYPLLGLACLAGIWFLARG
jgi:hypothetical protein